MGALYELLDDDGRKDFVRAINNAGIPGVKVEAQESIKCGVKGTHMEVRIFGETEDHHDHSHGHGIEDIEKIIKSLKLSQGVKEKVLQVYERIAQAEAAVHGEKPEHIHFHEVGSLDAVADVTGCCLLMEMLGADKVIFSPVNTGSGTVHCAHGILPVPAPATVLLLKGIPVYNNEIESELCTPTGAALAGAFADEFGSMPLMNISQIGYGMGTKDFSQTNCVRAMQGESEKKDGRVVELAANIDDMTGEEIGFAAEMMTEAGALDVYTQPIYMKKSRPAVKLCVITSPEEADRMAKLFFRYTTTLGIRKYTCDRHELNRHSEIRETAEGYISYKVSEGFGKKNEKPEYEELADIARKEKISLRKAYERLKNK